MSCIRSEHDRWLKDDGRNLQYTFEGIKPESIVFDVGVWTGLWTKEIAHRYNPNIFGFEPVRKFYRAVKEQFKSNSKIKIYNYGLGDENRQDTISVNRDSSSLFREGPTTESVVIKDISEVIASLGLEKINLLALNCEGCEYEILQRLISVGDISKVEKLLIQFHFIRDEDSMLRENLIHELAKTHSLNYCYLTVWELWSKND